jgi:hypothetical protein
MEKGNLRKPKGNFSVLKKDPMEKAKAFSVQTLVLV